MANRLYPKALQKFLEGSLHWLTDTIQVILVDNAVYTYSDSHEFLSDIPVGARYGTPQMLINKTTTDGAADADDVLFPAFTGPTIEDVIFVKSTGVDATSPLIGYWEDAIGLPFSASGMTIPIIFDNGPNKIFHL